MDEIRIDVARVDGLAVQLIEPICEQTDGCLRVEASLNTYSFIFSGEETTAIEAWQRVHDALQLIDPEGARLTLADPEVPEAEPLGGKTPIEPTRVELLQEVNR